MTDPQTPDALIVGLRERYDYDARYLAPRQGRFLPAGTPVVRSVDIGGAENAP